MPGGVALSLKEGFWVPHVGPEGGVGREHGLVPGGLGALVGKLIAEVETSGVKSFLVKGG